MCEIQKINGIYVVDLFYLKIIFDKEANNLKIFTKKQIDKNDIEIFNHFDVNYLNISFNDEKYIKINNIIEENL